MLLKDGVLGEAAAKIAIEGAETVCRKKTSENSRANRNTEFDVEDDMAKDIIRRELRGNRQAPQDQAIIKLNTQVSFETMAPLILLRSSLLCFCI